MQKKKEYTYSYVRFLLRVKTIALFFSSLDKRYKGFVVLFGFLILHISIIKIKIKLSPLRLRLRLKSLSWKLKEKEGRKKEEIDV